MTATKESSAVPAHKGLSRMAKIVITGSIVTAAAAGAAIAVVASGGSGSIGANGAKGIKFYSALENDVNASDAIGAMQYVIADLGGWLGNGSSLNLRLKGPDAITIFYIYDHYHTTTTSSELAANNAMFETIPEPMKSAYLRYAPGDYSGNCGDSCGPPESGCVCGNGEVAYVNMVYPTYDRERRVKLAVHEWYHVIQMNLCKGTNHLWSWLNEGAAASLEHLYASYYGLCSTYDRHGLDSCECEPEFNTCQGACAAGCVGCTNASASSGESGPDDCGLTSLHRFIRETRLEAANGLVLGEDQESMDGTIDNYPRVQTMFAYLAHLTSLKLAYKTFLTSGACQDLSQFEQTFGMSKSDFYASLNNWLINGNEAEILPSMAEITELFEQTELCSSGCSATTNDGGHKGAVC